MKEGYNYIWDDDRKNKQLVFQRLCSKSVCTLVLYLNSFYILHLIVTLVPASDVDFDGKLKLGVNLSDML